MWVDPRIRFGTRMMSGTAIADAAEVAECVVAEDRIAVATQWQLIWWRFRKHKLAVGGDDRRWSLFYLVALFADFFAYVDPTESEAQRSLIAPQPIHWFDDEAASTRMCIALKGTRDPLTFKRVYVPDTSTQDTGHVLRRTASRTSCSGFIPTDRHLIAVRRRQAERVAVPARHRHARARPVVAAHVRDAHVDDHRPGRRGAEPGARRRARRHLRATSAARSTRSSSASSRSCARSRRSRCGWASPPRCPPTGASLQVYFAITIIISLIGWTELARVVRGRFLSLQAGGFRHGRRARRLQRVADHLPPHGAVVPQPHHRRDDASRSRR